MKSFINKQGYMASVLRLREKEIVCIRMKQDIRIRRRIV